MLLVSTNILSPLVKSIFCCMMVLVLFAFSCGHDEESKDLEEKLTAICIRECVLETGGSEECDSSCRCAARKISAEYTKSDLINLVQALTQGSGSSAESVLIFKNTVKSCRNPEG